MRKILSIVLAVTLIVASLSAFAETDDKYYRVAFSNPSVEIKLPDKEANKATLTGLEASYSRGKAGEDMAHVFDLSVNDTSAVRAVILQNAQRLLAGVQGMNKMFSFPVGANEKAEAAMNIDLSALLKFTEAFNFTDEGVDTQEFMYGARLTAAKTSLKLDNAQLNDIIDSASSIFNMAGFDVEGFKSIEKGVAVDIWTTDDNKYLKIEAEIDASNCDQFVHIPMTLQGKQNDNGTIDIAASMAESDVLMNVTAHISPDEEHPLHPSMNVDVSVVSDDEEVLYTSFVTGCSHLEDSTTRAVSLEIEAMGEAVFKAQGSKKEAADQTTYIFKAGLNDELSAYCATKPYENEQGKGDSGYIDISLDAGDCDYKFTSDLDMGVVKGNLDIGDMQSLETIEGASCTDEDVKSVTTDLYIIAIRAIGVLTDIPEVSDLINSALAA